MPHRTINSLDYQSDAFTNQWLQGTDAWLQDTYADPIIADQDDIYFGTNSPAFSWNDTYTSPTTSSNSSNFFDRFDTSMDATPVEEVPTTQASRSSSPEISHHVEKPKRGRGRPKAIHTADSLKLISTTRTPHNQVERKYRDGLNAELDRLRMAIPSTARWESCASPGSSKPSKAMILACAIDYIREVERERDCLAAEVEMLQR